VKPIIFFGVRGEDVGNSNANLREQEITKLSTWKNLPAVKAGNVHTCSVQSFYFNEILALTHQSDFIVEKLTTNN